MGYQKRLVREAVVDPSVVREVHADLGGVVGRVPELREPERERPPRRTEPDALEVDFAMLPKHAAHLLVGGKCRRQTIVSKQRRADKRQAATVDGECGRRRTGAAGLRSAARGREPGGEGRRLLRFPSAKSHPQGVPERMPDLTGSQKRCQSSLCLGKGCQISLCLGKGCQISLYPKK